MATLSQYSFHPRNIKGSMVGASQVQPTGTDGYLYYDVVQDAQSSAPAAVTNISANLNGYVGGSGSGKRVGIIAYDFVNARWSILWTVRGMELVNNGWINDAGAIQDFINSLPTPQIGTLVAPGSSGLFLFPGPYPASFPPVTAG